jgi:hypothetical protein
MAGDRIPPQLRKSLQLKGFSAYARLSCPRSPGLTHELCFLPLSAGRQGVSVQRNGGTVGAASPVTMSLRMRR